MRKSNLLHLLLACLVMVSCMQQPENVACYQVVPMPNSITVQEGDAYVLNAETRISHPADNAEMKRNAEFLSQYVKENTGIELKTTAEAAKGIALVIDENVKEAEGYRLTINAEGVTIAGSTPAGVFYGIQTLRKSIPVAVCESVALPAVEINDAPRFAYRGNHFDVSRHFFTVEEVKRFIDIQVLHNANRLHWHLTDDQGWRIEIKKYPLLTEISSYRPETVIGHNTGEYDGTPHSGFYTQEQIKEIVAYAAERYITVIPEIDLPGHMQAALAAYPQYGCTGGPYEVWKMWGVSDNVLCAGNDETYKFIEDVLTEVVELFPSEYIHIGGDECPKGQWQVCPKCQARIKELGIKGDDKHSAEMYLQSHVISHAEKFLNSLGRQIIGWDEILEGGLAPNATVHSWRGVSGGLEAARQKHNAIMSPNTFMYFDYYQAKDADSEPIAIGGYLPVEKVYSYEPIDKVLTEEEAKYIIGVQANLWTEYIPDFKQVEYMLLPRAAALAEVQWTQPEHKNYDCFLQRIVKLVKMYDNFGYNYARHIFDVKAAYKPDTESNCIMVTLSNIDGAPIYYTTDGTEPTEQSSVYAEPIKITQNTTIKAKSFRGDKVTATLCDEMSFNKATAKKIEMLQPIYRGYSYDGAQVLVDGFCGKRNYKTGRWLGFANNDMEAVIDLGKIEEVSRVETNTYVEMGDWIFDARGFVVSLSEDGESYKEVYTQGLPAAKKDDPNIIKHYVLEFEKQNARFVKVKVISEKCVPDWHGARGGAGFLFVDEIIIN